MGAHRRPSRQLDSWWWIACRCASAADAPPGAPLPHRLRRHSTPIPQGTRLLRALRSSARPAVGGRSDSRRPRVARRRPRRSIREQRLQQRWAERRARQPPGRAAGLTPTARRASSLRGRRCGWQSCRSSASAEAADRTRATLRLPVVRRLHPRSMHVSNSIPSGPAAVPQGLLVQSNSATGRLSSCKPMSSRSRWR